MKLNGWQRAGLVASVLWAFAVAATGYHQHGSWDFVPPTGIRLPDGAFEFKQVIAARNQLEFSCLQAPDVLELPIEKQAEASKIYENLLYISLLEGPRAKALGPWSAEWVSQLPAIARENAAKLGCQAKTVEVEPPRYERQFGFSGMFRYAILPIILAWATAYLSLFAYRWIAAGFKGNGGTNGQG